MGQPWCLRPLSIVRKTHLAKLIRTEESNSRITTSPEIPNYHIINTKSLHNITILTRGSTQSIMSILFIGPRPNANSIALKVLMSSQLLAQFTGLGPTP